MQQYLVAIVYNYDQISLSKHPTHLNTIALNTLCQQISLELSVERQNQQYSN